MRARLKALLPVVCCFCAGAASGTHLPAPSTWRLDAARSKFGSGGRARLIAITITADSDDRFSWRSIVQETDGKLNPVTWDGKRDGVIRSVTGMGGARASYTADGKAHWTFSDGSSAEDSTTMGADGRSFTIERAVKKGSAVEQLTMVYDRTK